jgi:catechol 2,3-dioxygenase-like lactoylglutathione lyase family enzyme
MVAYFVHMALDLFAGIRVSDYATARQWYERLLGGEPTMLPHDTEAVWELGEHRHVYIVEDAANPGGAAVTIFVDNFDTRVAAIAANGIEPDERETYSNGVRKAIYRDADGNEVGFGGPPERLPKPR